MEIVIVDIETTGFYNSDAIVEIAVALVDTKTKQSYLIFDNVVKDKKFSPAKHSNSWIFKNATLTLDDVMRAKPLEDYLDELQKIFDKYPMTAYNKPFDLRFLRACGLKINDIDCLMKKATQYSNYADKNGRVKKPSVEEIYNQFFVIDGQVYIEKHRAGADVMDEARILLHMVDLKADKSPKTLIISDNTAKSRSKLIDVDHVITFGKHKDKTFSAIVSEDANYLKWCVKAIKTFKITPEAKKLLFSKKK